MAVGKVGISLIENYGGKFLQAAKNVTNNSVFLKTVSKSSGDVLELNSLRNGQETTKCLTEKLMDTIKSIFKREPIKKELYKKNVENAAALFKEKTGLKLHVACTDDIWSFAMTPEKVIKYIDKGQFPKELKHLVLGHGTGSTLNDTWVVSGTNEKVFEYVKNNVPKGEKALVCCCEETPKNLSYLLPKDKPGIGRVVHTELCTKRGPAKIVESGKDEIIGSFSKGITRYY